MKPDPSPRLLAPLAEPVFRRIWSASLLSNLGVMIQGVGAAWTMSHLTADAGMVTLVQSAIMLPVVLLALPAGALSDSFDRRIICIAALSLALTGAIGLSILAFADLLSPWILLAFCFIVGAGTALYGPSWQASVSEQVSADTLPSAIALNGVSYNVARAFGPAIGGVLVATAGALGAFLANVFAYAPLLVVLLLWKRRQEPRRLAPESLGRAIMSGVRFMSFSSAHRRFVVRTLVFTSTGSVILSLPPLIARDLLGGDALLYGLLLGAVGIGAVGGALFLPILRARLGAEALVRAAALLSGAAILVTAFSRNEAATIAAMLAAGVAWTSALTLFSVSIQVSAPRWVSGRALAVYQAAAAAGTALGSWFWGAVVDASSLQTALIAAGTAMTTSTLLGLALRLPDVTRPTPSAAPARGDPEVALDLTPRSGPIVIEIDYVAPAARARDFYLAMQKVRRFRQRTGAYGWSLSRDIADATRWTERFHSPTWNDYLHLLQRGTATDRAVIEAAHRLLSPDEPLRVRRLLERPAGSVRQTEDTPDRGVDPVSLGGSGGA